MGTTTSSGTGAGSGSLSRSPYPSRPRHPRPFKASATTLQGVLPDLDVVTPAAVMALAIAYLGTNHVHVAARLFVPVSAAHIAAARPDLTMLRVLARCLILWDHVGTSEMWIQTQLPAPVRGSLGDLLKQWARAGVPLSDVQARSSTHLHVLAGLCLGMGLRFAGTLLTSTRDTLLRIARRLLELKASLPESSTGPHPSQPVSKQAIENALCATATAASLVMAGTGDPEVLQLLHAIQRRRHLLIVPGSGGADSGPQMIRNHILYGHHAVIALALGILFLSAGHASLANTPAATAALLLSMYPHFHGEPADNRYYPQMLRHMYVLAAEERRLTVRDEAGLTLAVPVEITVRVPDASQDRDAHVIHIHENNVKNKKKKSTTTTTTTTTTTKTWHLTSPTLLPPRDMLLRIRVLCPGGPVVDSPAGIDALYASRVLLVTDPGVALEKATTPTSASASASASASTGGVTFSSFSSSCSSPSAAELAWFDPLPTHAPRALALFSGTKTNTNTNTKTNTKTKTKMHVTIQTEMATGPPLGAAGALFAGIGPGGCVTVRTARDAGPLDSPFYAIRCDMSTALAILSDPSSYPSRSGPGSGSGSSVRTATTTSTRSTLSSAVLAAAWLRTPRAAAAEAMAGTAVQPGWWHSEAGRAWYRTRGHHGSGSGARRAGKSGGGRSRSRSRGRSRGRGRGRRRRRRRRRRVKKRVGSDRVGDQDPVTPGTT